MLDEELIVELERLFPKPEHRQPHSPYRGDTCTNELYSGCEECCGCKSMDCNECITYLGVQEKIAKIRRASKEQANA